MFYPVDDLRDETICLRLDHTCDAQPEKHWLPAYYSERQKSFYIAFQQTTDINTCEIIKVKTSMSFTILSYLSPGRDESRTVRSAHRAQ